MDNVNSSPDNINSNAPSSVISHSPAVAVGNYKDGVGTIWTGIVLTLSGLYPLITLLTSVDNPRYMTTLGSWLLVSLLMFAGLIVLGFGVKEKGYQKDSIRTFAIIAFFSGIVLFLGVPVAASLMYAAGAGN